MIRLLEKSEVAKSNAVQRQQEIDEGMKVARRVDSLRELVAHEEATLNDFRERRMAEISGDIKKEEEKLEKLGSEVKILRNELASETNLTREERKGLEKLKASLENRAREIEDRANEVNLLEIDIAIVRKEANQFLQFSRSAEQESKLLLSDASQKDFQAENALSRARKIEAKALSDANEQNKAFELRESSLDAREKELSGKELENSRIRKELDIEKVQLADQRATLEQALERIKRNRL
jgi:hypothetical protein